MPEAVSFPEDWQLEDRVSQRFSSLPTGTERIVDMLSGRMGAPATSTINFDMKHRLIMYMARNHITAVETLSVPEAIL